MRACIRVVQFVSVREICAESGRGLGDNKEEPTNTYLSLRSTGERLSNIRVGSPRMAFQLPTPCCGVFEFGRVRCRELIQCLRGYNHRQASASPQGTTSFSVSFPAVANHRLWRWLSSSSCPSSRALVLTPPSLGHESLALCRPGSSMLARHAARMAGQAKPAFV